MQGRRPRKSSSGSALCRLKHLPACLLLLAIAITFPILHKANRSLQKLDDDSFLAEQQPQLPITIYDDDTIAIGTLTHKPPQFFQSIQQAIDKDDTAQRCARYGFGNSSADAVVIPPRRIFFGSLIADEPWELLEIVATETYGIFAGMVWVESNRTQSAAPRPFKRKEKHVKRLASLFGIHANQIQLRRYVNEDDLTIEYLAREHRQRHEILKGWKALGMRPQDIGYIADADETFTRDFLRAVQTCSNIPALDYNQHHCFNPRVKIAASTRMFEASPECLTKDRTWYHPDLILGACVELIGNETANPRAPRKDGEYLRAPGFGHNCETKTAQKYHNSFGNITGNQFPLWNSADFRRQCGGHNYELNATHHAKYTAFHFHNFFADFSALRQKYSTYGHPVRNAFRKRLEVIGDDLKMMVRCVQNWTDAPLKKTSSDVSETQQWQRESGGYPAALPPLPIYFMDPEYRQRKHAAVLKAVLEDEDQRQRRVRLQPHERKAQALQEEAKELKRQSWRKEAQAQDALKARHT